MKLNPSQPESYKLGEQVFYGYPLEHSGLIQGILTRKQFKQIDFHPDNYNRNDRWDFNSAEAIKNRPHHAFDAYLEITQRSFPQFDISNTQCLVFLKETQCFVRTFYGHFLPTLQQHRKEMSFQIAPITLISRRKFYENTKDTIKFDSIEDEFPIGDQVLILNSNNSTEGQRQKLIGAIGKVYGHNKELNKVKVKVIRESKKIDDAILQEVANTDEIFFSLRLVCQLVGVRSEIIMKIIDTLSIEGLPKNKGLPDSIDIGLNFISRREEKLVPNLVRINFSNDIPKNTDLFKRLQFSVKAVQLIVEYKNNYNEVFRFIEQRHNRLVEESNVTGKGINWREEIRLDNIFGDQEKSVKALMKVYIWLIKKEQTHMPLSSVYSKQISAKKIKQIQIFFQENKNKKTKRNYKEPAQLEFDPNFLFSYRLSRNGYPYLVKAPQNHAIGDQIVCLKPRFFGDFGIVVGIDDGKCEVVFEKASFGKTDLGGICDSLRGGKFNFRELFNYKKWPSHIVPRNNDNKNTKVFQKGWIQSHDDFYPKFRSKPLHKFQDIHVVKKLIPQSLYSYICKVQQSLKQTQLEEGYKVVDNKRQDYAYKYDDHQQTIPEEQVKNMQKQTKYMEKLTEKQQEKAEKNQEFVPEVIESKTQEPQQTIAQEQDGQDILS